MDILSGQKRMAKIKSVSCVDFPGSPVDENSLANAGDMDLIPGLGTKIPHAAGHLCLRAQCTTMKTQCDQGEKQTNKQT